MKTRARILTLVTSSVFALSALALGAGPALAGPITQLDLHESAQLNHDLLGQLDVGTIGDPPGPDIGDPPFEGTLGDPPFDSTLGDPPKEPPTVVVNEYTEGPCIDGYKQVTDYTEYSDGTAASSIALIPCDTCTIAEESWMIDCNTCYIDSCGQVHCTQMLCTDNDDVPTPGNDNPGDVPQPEPTPIPVTPPVTATSLPHTGSSLAFMMIVGGSLLGAAATTRLVLRKIK